MTRVCVAFELPDGTTRQVDDIEPGISLMQAARAAGVPGILADCGGSCACATCHVYVSEAWAEAVGPPNALEADLLEMVDSAKPGSSRLCCQIVVEDRLHGLQVAVAQNE
jgi:ferredoxin, 2Fe-2S